MWIWFLAGFLIVLVWLGGGVLATYDVPVSTSLEVILTLLIVLIFGVVLAVRYWREQRAATALENELLRQSDQQAANARPDRRAEIQQLSQKMQQGIQSLKQSRLGGRALQSMPWYAIIGPPGSGKTTALRHSGLSFSFLEEGGRGALRGVGGTRNCDWWFTSQAILLDTAGRWSTQDDDREEWLAFLSLLRRYRPVTPMNGVIVGVALPQLLDSSESQVVETAKHLRARLDEIMTRLGLVMPVYLMFTKADMVSGFIEFWEDLRKSERDQVFGATLPLRGTGDPRAAFIKEFDALVGRTHARAIRQIGRLRQPVQRQQTFRYPLEFAATREAIGDFITQLFQANPFQEQVLFRGFYFTSGTQEGRPADRVVSGMARAFGIAAPALPAAPFEPKSYFVTDLFQRVIFPDQKLAGRSATRRNKEFMVAAGLVLGAMFLGAVLALPAALSANNNWNLVEETQALAAKIRQTRGAPPPQRLAQLTIVGDRLDTLEDWRLDGAPPGYRWGMYVGNQLLSPLRKAYATELTAPLIQPIRGVLENQLRSYITVRKLHPTQHARAVTDLKLYLMLGTPPRLDVEWAASQIPPLWEQATASPAATELVTRHAEMWLGQIKAGETLPLVLDQQLVAQLQERLRAAPRMSDTYDSLIEQTNQEVPPIKRGRFFSDEVMAFVEGPADAKIPGAYTREGWDVVRSTLEANRKSLTSDRWVLGQTETQAQAEIDQQVKDMQAKYVIRFRDTWKDTLMSLRIKQATSAAEAVKILQALSSETPYERMIRALQDNVVLDQETEDRKLAMRFLNQQIKKTETRIKAQTPRIVTTVLNTPLGPQVPPVPRYSPAAQKGELERAFWPLLSFIADDNLSADPPAGSRQYGQVVAQLQVRIMDYLNHHQSAKEIQSAVEQALSATDALIASQSVFTRPILLPYLRRPLEQPWLQEQVSLPAR